MTCTIWTVLLRQPTDCWSKSNQGKYSEYHVQFSIMLSGQCTRLPGASKVRYHFYASHYHLIHRIFGLEMLFVPLVLRTDNEFGEISMNIIVSISWFWISECWNNLLQKISDIICVAYFTIRKMLIQFGVHGKSVWVKCNWRSLTTLVSYHFVREIHLNKWVFLCWLLSLPRLFASVCKTTALITP